MSKEIEVLPLVGEKGIRESKNAVIACNDYLRMGPGRSFSKLLKMYESYTDEEPPVIASRTIMHWSSRFSWQLRAQAYDQRVQNEKDRLLDEKRKEVLLDGVALDYERVRKLKQLEEFLWNELQDRNNVWLEDVKRIGYGEESERISLIRFNSQLFYEYRAVLNDIAKEVGDRKGEPININVDNRRQGIVVVPEKANIEEYIKLLDSGDDD